MSTLTKLSSSLTSSESLASSDSGRAPKNKQLVANGNKPENFVDSFKPPNLSISVSSSSEEQEHHSNSDRVSAIFREIDRSGRNATKPGFKGVKGFKGTLGHRGGKGGDGGDGTSGDRGGDVNLKLSVYQDRSIQAKTGVEVYTFPLGHRRVFLNITSNGGDGSRGGDGGKGGRGSRGYTGESATRFHPGRNGGPGAQGGDGGHGGSGGSGGRGGHVNVSVSSIRDADLFTIIGAVSNKGGKGGEGGQGGRGGSGGYGGYGGAKYSYTEKVAKKDHEFEYLNDGSLLPGQSKYNYVKHYQPGGSKGAKGLQGFPGSPGLRGYDGASGDLYYWVGRQRFTGLYNLGLSFYRQITSDDGIIEPGETLGIRDLTFINDGRMPTPLQKIKVYLANTRWIRFSDVDALYITKSINNALRGKNTFTCQKSLNFTVKVPPPVVNKIFQKVALIDFRAKLDRVNQPFQEVAKKKVRLNIRYPVEMSVGMIQGAICRGEVSPFAVKVRNVSTKDIGNATLGKRPLELYLRVESGIDGSKLRFTRKDGKQQLLSQPIKVDISRLSAKGETTFSGLFEFVGSDTPNYTRVELRLDLVIGKVDSPQEKHVIQRRSLFLQLAKRYEFHPDADLILVVNNQTSRQTVLQWDALAKSLQTRLSIWNTSLYSGIDFNFKPIGSKSFLELWKNRTVIFLDNTFPHGTVGLKKRSTEFLDKMALFEAAKESHISFYVIGSNFDMSQAITPLHNYERNPLKTIKKVLKREKTLGNPLLRNHDSLEVKNRSSKEKHLVKKAKRLSRKYSKRFPHQRVVFTHHYDRTKIRGGIRKKWSLGTVEMRRTLGAMGAHIVFHAASMQKYSVTDFDAYIMFKLMPFRKKLSYIQKMLHDKRNSPLLLSALLSDLVDELKVFTQHKWRGHLPQPKLRPLMQHSLELSNYDFSSVTMTREGSDFLAELLIKYKYLVKKLPTPKDRRLLRRRANDVVSVCLKRVKPVISYNIPVNKVKVASKGVKVLWKKEKSRNLLSMISDPYHGSEKLIKYDHKVELASLKSSRDLPNYRRLEERIFDEKKYQPQTKEAAMILITEQEARCFYDTK